MQKKTYKIDVSYKFLANSKCKNKTTDAKNVQR